jgi:hypothetical protein
LVKTALLKVRSLTATGDVVLIVRNVILPPFTRDRSSSAYLHERLQGGTW